MSREPKTPKYVVRTWVSGFRAIVLFNDWPAARHFDDEHGSVAAVVNALLLEGTNTLRVLAWPSETLAEGATPSFKVELVKGDPDDHDASVVLYRMQWDPDTHPLAKDGRTEIVRHVIRPKKAFGRWAWEEAQPYQDRDRDEIVRRLESFWSALVAKDAGRAVEFVRVKLEEQARATQRDPGGVATNQQKWLAGFMTHPDWSVAPFEPEALTFESWALGKLVEVRHKERGSAVRAMVGDMPMDFDMMLSQLGTGWAVAR